MDRRRRWMYGSRTSIDFVNGLDEFRRVALEYKKKVGSTTIFCPCRDCRTIKRWENFDIIEDHLYRVGFMKDYVVWFWHGEKYESTMNEHCENNDEMSSSDKGNDEILGNDNDGGEKDLSDDDRMSDYLHDETDWLDLEEELVGESSIPSNVSIVPKKHQDPWIRYQGIITKDQWERFKASYLTQKAREKRKKAIICSKKNKHPHHMGQNSYSRAIPKWSDQKRLSPPRAVDVDKLRYEIFEEFEQKFAEKFKERESKFAEIVASEVSKQIATIMASGIFPIPKTRVHDPHTSVFERPISKTRVSERAVFEHPRVQLRIIDKLTPCFLAVIDDNNNERVVAKGTTYPNFPSQPPKPNHYTVSVDEVYPDCSEIKLPVPSEDGMTTMVGAAEKHFVDWPASLVIWDEEHTQSRIQRRVRPKVTSSQPIISATSTPFTKNVGLELGSMLLQSLISKSKDRTTYQKFVEVNPPFLYYRDRTKFLVASTDVKELLQGKELNVSCMQVYQMYLRDNFTTLFGSSISFLCPALTSPTQIMNNMNFVIDYVRDAFISENDKGARQAKYILAPYNEGFHWYLFVIDLQGGNVFIFDSSGKDINSIKGLKLLQVLKITFVIYKADGGTSRKKTLKLIPIHNCAQQLGKTECGYYVLKWMKEIAMTYFESANLDNDYSGSREPFSLSEINAVRDDWTQYYMSLLMDDEEDED